jgi:hypothetical protein
MAEVTLGPRNGAERVLDDRRGASGYELDFGADRRKESW